MSKKHLREDKTCLNCGNHVEERFCGKCGQENTETRQTFGHLVRHFLEDITHYEGSFWRTLKYLLFRPGYLAMAFLAGKRVSYLPPVRLYIFVSFVAFSISYLLPEGDGDYKYPVVMPETIKREKNFSGMGMGNGRMFYVVSDFHSVAQYDSVQNTMPAALRETGFFRWASIKQIELGKVDPDVLEKKFEDSFAHNFPKALFVYMPLFAFVLWLFHNRKKWMYFDHAIFTLYYFSCLLISFTVINIIVSIFGTPAFFDYKTNANFLYLISFLVFLSYIIVYFYKANRKMYQERWIVAFFKATLMLAINMTLFVALMTGLAFLTVFNLHG
jgi:hypothetical protein